MEQISSQDSNEIGLLVNLYFNRKRKQDQLSNSEYQMEESDDVDALDYQVHNRGHNEVRQNDCFINKKRKIITINEDANEILAYKRKKFHITVSGEENLCAESDDIVQGINLLEYLDMLHDSGQYYLEEVFGLCIKIAIGLSFLQEQDMAHTDLEARNIIVSHDCKAITILDTSRTTDVGGNEYFVKTKLNTRLPLIYMAPECLENETVSAKSDVYAFGIIMYMMFIVGSEDCIEEMIDFLDEPDLINRLKNGVRPIFCGNPFPDIVRNDMYDLISECWSCDVAERPMFKEVVKRLGEIKKILDDENEY